MCVKWKFDATPVRGIFFFPRHTIPNGYIVDFVMLFLNSMEYIHETSQIAQSYRDDVSRTRKTVLANWIFELCPGQHFLLVTMSVRECMLRLCPRHNSPTPPPPTNRIEYIHGHFTDDDLIISR